MSFGRKCIFLIVTIVQLHGEALGQDNRLPVPLEREQAKYLAQIENEFAAEASSGSNELKVDVVRKLMIAARDTTQDSALRYALLSQSLLLAESAADFKLGLEIVRQLGETYQVDRWASIEDFFDRNSRRLKSTQQLESLLKELGPSVAAAVSELAFEEADDLVSLGQKLNRRTGNKLRANWFDQKRKRVKELVKLRQQFDRASEKLKSEPNHLNSKIKSGLYYCFVTNDLETGLSILASCTGDNLAQIAQQDLGANVNAEQILAVAEAWVVNARNETGHIAEGKRSRSKKLLLALPEKLTGLKKLVADKLLNEIKTTEANENGNNLSDDFLNHICSHTWQVEWKDNRLYRDLVFKADGSATYFSQGNTHHKKWSVYRTGIRFFSTSKTQYYHFFPVNGEIVATHNNQDDGRIFDSSSCRLVK
ncbi:MAG: hypothetical protein P8J27_07655 [Mariniblastus sp.]|nr:hypothetical protein [Mariniblastus sp.]